MSGERTYRDECHMDGCETAFIGVTREEYENHLREKHGKLIGDIWEQCLIDMTDQKEPPGLERIECTRCDVQPTACWDTENETIALACECGERMVPRDAVLEHDLMPDGTAWSVVEPQETGREADNSGEDQ